MGNKIDKGELAEIHQVCGRDGAAWTLTFQLPMFYLKCLDSTRINVEINDKGKCHDIV